MGAYLQQAAKALLNLDIVDDVRRLGLMLGVDQVADKATKAPLAGASEQIFKGCVDRGVVVRPVGSRVGTEVSGQMRGDFYGASFIADHLGARVAEATRTDETYLTAGFDLDERQEYRRAWGIFRDRRARDVWRIAGVGWGDGGGVKARYIWQISGQLCGQS